MKPRMGVSEKTEARVTQQKPESRCGMEQPSRELGPLFWPRVGQA